MATQLPYDAHAEAAVLGSILLDPECYITVQQAIQNEDSFFIEKHKLIFAAMIAVIEQRTRPDLITLSRQLANKGHLELVGGIPAIMELSNAVPTATGVGRYAEIVATLATLRDIIALGGKIAAIGYDTNQTRMDALSRMMEMVNELSTTANRGVMTSMEDLASEYYREIEMLSDNPDMVSGVKTGYTDFDKITGGLQKKELTTLGARPGTGKTSLALNIALNAAKNDARVAVFSLEMSSKQLMSRMVTTHSGIDTRSLRTGIQRDDMRKLFTDTIGQLSKLPIFIDETPGITIPEMMAKCLQLKAMGGLDLVVVDYLQLIQPSGRKNQNRTQEVSDISRGLKLLSMTLDIPVLALSQLSRTVESRISKVPMLSDLRESGSVEQDSDNVLFIYREELYDPETDKKGLAEIHIAKHRNGATGIVPLRFFSSTTKFENLETFRTEDGAIQPGNYQHSAPAPQQPQQRRNPVRKAPPAPDNSGYRVPEGF